MLNLVPSRQTFLKSLRPTAQPPRPRSGSRIPLEKRVLRHRNSVPLESARGFQQSRHTHVKATTSCLITLHKRRPLVVQSHPTFTLSFRCVRNSLTCVVKRRGRTERDCNSLCFHRLSSSTRVSFPSLRRLFLLPLFLSGVVLHSRLHGAAHTRGRGDAQMSHAHSPCAGLASLQHAASLWRPP